MNASAITLDSLVARQGQEGRLHASGTVTLQRLAPSGYNLKLRGRNFAASDPGIYAGQFDGDFTVTDGPRGRGQWLPDVAGGGRGPRGGVLIDFANQSEGG